MSAPMEANGSCCRAPRELLLEAPRLLPRHEAPNPLLSEAFRKLAGQ